jgi:site-specific DNA-adenine methylase
MKSPYPYFGGKSRVAALVWERLGNPANYIEPFFGGGAVLLNRPAWHAQAGWPLETINDLNGYVENFWRAVKSNPAGIACTGKRAADTEVKARLVIPTMRGKESGFPRDV